jgi:hypothetical protein
VLAAHTDAASITVPVELVTLQPTTRVRSPPQDALHSVHADTSYVYVVHANELHAREDSGRAANARQSDSSAATFAIESMQVMVRVDAPPPHC